MGSGLAGAVQARSGCNRGDVQQWPEGKQGGPDAQRKHGQPEERTHLEIHRQRRYIMETVR